MLFYMDHKDSNLCDPCKKACVQRKYKATLIHDIVYLGLQAEPCRKPVSNMAWICQYENVRLPQSREVIKIYGHTWYMR